MVKLKRFEITFTNPERAYFAGQEIAGKIILELAEEKLISEILLELKGRSKTYWAKSSGKNRSHLSQSEPYFLEQLNTNYTHSFNRMAADGKSIERVIPAGVHEIPFSYTLPKNLPTSFEGEFGFVRYTCRVVLERPWDTDLISYCAFTVIGIEDINCDTEALAPAGASDSNYNVTTFCCRRAGVINVQVSLPRTGYTPGETILVNGVINNQSQRPIKGSALHFKQKVTYRAKTFSGTEHVKSTCRTIEKREKGEIGPNSEFKWVNEPIVIPSLTPRLSRCGIIDVTYIIELEADSAVSVQLPVIIGSIPRISDIVEKMAAKTALNNATTANEKQANEAAANGDDRVRVMITDEAGRTVVDNDNSAAREADDSELLTYEAEVLIQNKKRVRMPSSILSELYPSLPPPYYRESYFGSVDITDEKESVQFGSPTFAPKYPFY
ncbi:Arrestin domain-containing protein 2 [Aphelenchoides fujianensis]|nr:Arrestin domain-containing protein 2 [Aphelenchoides fujianensis]